VANIDFTLDDIRTVVGEVFDQKFDEKFDKKFDEKFESAFNKAFTKAFNKDFMPAFEAAFDPYALAIQEDFNRIHERFDRLERIVDQHSREIIELRSLLT